MFIKFWGVRGGVAAGGQLFQKTGGDTSCVSVALDEDNILVFDAGSGIVALGQELLNHKSKKIHLFFSHLHYDHVIGLPFFEPLYDSTFSLNIYAPTVDGAANLSDFLNSKLFSRPLFPVPFNITNPNIKLFDLKAHDTLNIGSAKIIVAPLFHPGGSAGYRLTMANKVLTYISDTEHETDAPNVEVLKLIKDADLVIYDATYTEEEYLARRGWGHSTPEEGIKLCQLANAKKLALYHHSHLHTDEMLKEIEANAKKIWKNVFLSVEGMEITL